MGAEEEVGTTDAAGLAESFGARDYFKGIESANPAQLEMVPFSYGGLLHRGNAGGAEEDVERVTEPERRVRG